MTDQYLSGILLPHSCKEVTPVLRHSGSCNFLLFSRLAFHTGNTAFPVIFPSCALDSSMYNVILNTSKEKMQGLEFVVYLGS